MDNLGVRRVIIVSKTHLDVGYTDFAATVLQRYVDSFIPKALDLAFLVNTPEKKRFVWTTGSYLIKYYIEHADKTEKARCMDALRLGYVRYHALALTTHTELMSRELFLYDLSIAKRLDALLGRKTIAAKMTDVPGHTIAMVPALAKSGVTYLHIAVSLAVRGFGSRCRIRGRIWRAVRAGKRRRAGISARARQLRSADRGRTGSILRGDGGKIPERGD
jgi:hypothetical protein